MSSEECGIRTCRYTVPARLARYTTVDRDVLSIDIPILQPEHADVDEYVAVFGERGLLDVIDEVDLRKDLTDFIRNETGKYQEERDDQLVKQALESGFELPNIEASPVLMDDPCESFANKFSYVMQNSPCSELAELMRRQIAMAVEMNQIIRVRNWEVGQLRSKCENAVNDASSNLDAHPHELSKLNEKLRNLHASYACQIEVLTERQRKDFRDLVDILYNGGSIVEMPRSEQHMAHRNSPQQAKSHRELSNEAVSESYTIYIGAQLKSMHNVSLLTANSMVELCSQVEGIDESSLLQMSISLYGNQLSALVTLVPRDPLWHTTSGSEFARVCEQSVELHFDSLSRQLNSVVESAAQAKCWREESASERTKTAEGRENSTKGLHDTTLEVGDVYCTRHSNLRDAQLVFHLVVDDALHSIDISSRHPCLNGIRNIIRLTMRLGITSLRIPLLLVEKASENMTIAWCLRRAEMVYKCVKGYLMEVCGVCGGSAVGGGVTSVPHFNIYLVLPSGLADGVYQQISAMFPTIFHLVPSVSMPAQEL